MISNGNQMNPNTEKTVEIDIMSILRALRKKLFLVIIVTLAFAAAAFAYSKFLITPLYRTSFTVYVNNNIVQGEKQSISSSDMNASRYLADTYAQIIKGHSVLTEAAQNAGVNKSYASLSKSVTTELVGDTELITVFVSSESPEQARAFAESIAQVAEVEISSIIDGSSMRVVDDPILPDAPYLPSKTKNTAIGAIAGFVIIAVIVVLRELLDDRVKDDEELENKYGIAVLGKIPNYNEAQSNSGDYGYGYGGYGAKSSSSGSRSSKKDKKSNSKNNKKSGKKNAKDAQVTAKSIMLKDSSPFSMKESYRALRTNVMFSLPDSSSKCIGITSSVRGDGKSTSSMNFALSLSQIGKKVLLMDCDLRLPVMASNFAVEQRPGLSNLLIGQVSVKEAVRNVAPNLDLIPAGSIPRDPTNLLESKQIGDLINSLKLVYDYVIVDLTPVTTVTDAAVLSKHINGYLLVVRHNKTEYKFVTEMLRQLDIAEAKVLGFLYNDVIMEGKKSYYKKSYYYYYHHSDNE